MLCLDVRDRDAAAKMLSLAPVQSRCLAPRQLLRLWDGIKPDWNHVLVFESRSAKRTSSAQTFLSLSGSSCSPPAGEAEGLVLAKTTDGGWDSPLRETSRTSRHVGQSLVIAVNAPVSVTGNFDGFIHQAANFLQQLVFDRWAFWSLASVPQSPSNTQRVTLEPQADSQSLTPPFFN